MRLLHTLLILLFTCLALTAGKIVDGEYHSVKARKGDGVDVLLQRYNLLADASLRSSFYTLNKLSKKDYIYAGKPYVLPVVLYNYNGTSIRSTIGSSDWETAVAIQQYNEALLSNGVRSTHFRDSKILWVPLHLNNGKKGKLPKIDKVKTPLYAGNTLSIYGSGNEIKKLVDNRMKGKVVYVVTGHGGPDPGAVCEDCTTRLCEDEYAYDVALRFARELESHGAVVEMVIQDKNDGIRSAKIFKCDQDERLADGSKLPLNQMKRLVQRTNYINKKYKQYQKKGYKDQVVVSVHIDANSKSTRQDVFFCYARGSKASRKLAANMSTTFAQKYNEHQKGRGYKGHLHERGIYVLRKTAPPAVLIELANIKNKHDHKRILLEGNRQALAKWMYDGIANHFNVPPVQAQVLASN